MTKEPQSNPWLSIPAFDYEGHMSSPDVGQLQFLSYVFGELLAEFQPRSLAVLGCATGNGFEHIQSKWARKVIGIDLNPEYLDVLRSRFDSGIPGLELICSDIASCELEPKSMDFIHGALVLEYLDSSIVVEKVSRWLKPGGVFAVVLQLPCESLDKVSETGFASLKRLEPIMNLVAPQCLKTIAQRCGLSEIRASTVSLQSGKPFFIGAYRLGSSDA